MTGPQSAHLASLLPDIGAGLAAQLVDLHRDPTPERAERLALNLEGARRSTLNMREAMLREGCGDGS